MSDSELPPEVEQRLEATGAVRGALALVASLIVGTWLITQGWVFIGGAAVLAGVFSGASVLKPRWLADGLLAIFWAAWSGLGLYVLLRDGRWFVAIPVFFLFLGGLARVRGLFKRGPKPLPAAERVIEGEVAQTRPDKPREIQRD